MSRLRAWSPQQSNAAVGSNLAAPEENWTVLGHFNDLYGCEGPFI